jgi:multidrug efflux pump subunit AcrA (membrane-fusion protein)
MPLLAFLPAIWSFITSRFGVLIIACLLAFGSGYSIANRKAEVERLNAEVATAKSDQATAQNAESLAQRQAADLDKRREANERRIAELQESLEQAKSNKPDTKVVTKTVRVPVPVSRDCGLNEDQLRRFKEIR